MRFKVQGAAALGAGLALATGLTGCGGIPTTHVDQHPAVVSAADRPHAKVYFIRPLTERNMGVADNAITIELDRKPLLTLVKGQYTLVDLKPGHYKVTVDSLTAMFLEPTTLRRMKRSAYSSFYSGGTYYIVMQMVNGKFRGVVDIPMSVATMKASRIVRHLRPFGASARGPVDPV